MAGLVLLYDGVCGLCNRLVRFILRHDRTGVFRFASLQSPLAARILARHGQDHADLDTVYLVLNYEEAGEAILARSDAIYFVLRKLGGVWRAAAFALRLVPRPVRDWLYSLIARNRNRIFGRYDACPPPSADTRARFLDQ